MWRLIFPVLSAVCSGCVSGPKVVVCISDPINHGFQCSDPDDNRSFLSYDDSENYVAFSPDDAKKLLQYCKGKK